MDANDLTMIVFLDLYKKCNFKIVMTRRYSDLVEFEDRSGQENQWTKKGFRESQLKISIFQVVSHLLWMLTKIFLRNKQKYLYKPLFLCSKNLLIRGQVRRGRKVRLHTSLHLICSAPATTYHEIVKITKYQMFSRI